MLAILVTVHSLVSELSYWKLCHTTKGTVLATRTTFSSPSICSPSKHMLIHYANHGICKCFSPLNISHPKLNFVLKSFFQVYILTSLQDLSESYNVWVEDYKSELKTQAIGEELPRRQKGHSLETNKPLSSQWGFSHFSEDCCFRRTLDQKLWFLKLLERISTNNRVAHMCAFCVLAKSGGLEKFYYFSEPQFLPFAK